MRLWSLALIGVLCVPAVAAAAKDAGELIVAGDYAAAEPLLRHQLASNPRDPNAHYNLAVVLKHTGRLDDAVLSYHRALDLYEETRAPESDVSKCLYGIAQTQELKGDARVAVGAWDNYIQFAKKYRAEQPALGIARMHIDGQMRAANMRGPYPFGPSTATRPNDIR